MTNRKAKETSSGLVQWFERNGLVPTMNSEKDMQTFRQHVKVGSYKEHKERK